LPNSPSKATPEQAANPATTVDAIDKPESRLPVDGDVVLLVNVNSGRCMSIRNGYRVAQSLTPDQANDHEQWKTVAVGMYFKLVNIKTGNVLAVPQGTKTPGIQLITWNDLNSEDQQWTIEKTGDDFTIKSRLTGHSVSVAYGKKEEGIGVIQWPFSKTPDQYWRIERVKPQHN
jgi:hypothetical protein